MYRWLSALFILTGCGARLQPIVSLDAVDPATAFEGAATPVVIRGSGFVAASHVDFSSGTVDVENGFAAWLDDTALEDVRRVDGTTLQATVPATLGVGAHTLSIETPQGARKSLAAAFVTLPRRCTVDVDCDDGDACDGTERCDAGTCVNGTPPSCPAPSDPCLTAACEPAQGCVTRPSVLADADGDGHLSRACGGDDCDDDPAACGAACHPGALEICDGFDNDCDPTTPDGAGESLLGQACDGPDADLCLDDAWICDAGKLTCSTGPDNIEIVGDGIDEDCDGVELCWQDRDGDGWGSAVVVSHPAGSCDDPAGGTASRTGDCDDDPAACGAACHPGGVELCDGWDNDCDPRTPDGATDTRLGLACDGPETAACDVYLGCTGGALTCGLGPGHVEGPFGSATCTDGIDNDCDGTADIKGVGTLPPDPKCASNLPPLVHLVVTPDVAEVGASFAADASGTRDDRDTLSQLRFDWDFGDGVTLAAAGPRVTHAYGAPGSRRIWVTATDTGGKAASAGFEVVVTTPGALISVDSEAALRAALVTASSTPERDVIRVTAASIALSDTLTVDTDVELVSDGTVFSAAYPGAGACLVLRASNIHLVGFTFTGCPTALRLAAGTGTQVERCSFHDNPAVVVWAAGGNTFGPNNDVGPNRAKGTVGIDATAAGVFDGNRIHDSGSHGISLSAGDGSMVERNTIYGNGGAGVLVGDRVSGTKVWFNTVDRNGDDGLRLGASSGTQVYDNLFTNNIGWAVNPLPGASLVEDYNDYFPSPRRCNGCTTGPHSLAMSPSYVSPGGADYRLLPGSPVIDRGLALGVDVNGPAPGDYTGAAPDLGAWESP
jgi:parallel beta-helix repeat protein